MCEVHFIFYKEYLMAPIFYLSTGRIPLSSSKRNSFRILYIGDEGIRSEVARAG